MKLNDVLELLSYNTEVKLVANVCGMDFSAECSADDLLGINGHDELLEKEIIEMRVIDNSLEIILEG